MLDRDSGWDLRFLQVGLAAVVGAVSVDVLRTLALPLILAGIAATDTPSRSGSVQFVNPSRSWLNSVAPSI